MRILDIEPLHDYDARSCLEDPIASILAWKGLSYEYMFLESWNFKYYPENFKINGTMGACLYYDEAGGIKHIKDYLGVDITTNNVTTLDCVLNVIKEQLSIEQPILICYDSYFLPWASKVHNAHISHPIIIVGYDEKDRKVNINDSYYLIRNELMSVEELWKGLDVNVGFFTFIFDRFKRKEENWQEIIEIAVNRAINGDIFSDIKKFANDLSEGLNLKAEFPESEFIWVCPLAYNIELIMRGREKLSQLFNFLYKKFNINELNSYSQEFKHLASKWKQVWTMIIKIVYNSNQYETLNRIALKLKEIASDEECIAKDMLSLINSNIDKTQNNNILSTAWNFDKSFVDVQCIDISDYLNNQGFHSNDYDEVLADLTGVGEYFYLDNISQNNLWNIGKITFAFPSLVNGRCDNMKCEGQIINVPKGKYSSLFFLGCSDWGNFSDKIIVSNNDISSELPFEFADMCLVWDKVPKFDNLIAWHGTCIKKNYKNEKEQRSGYIFVKQIQLDNSFEIEQICLPNCSNIHIFAISLGIQ